MVSTSTQPKRRPLWQAVAVAIVVVACCFRCGAWFDFAENYLQATICYINDVDVSPVAAGGNVTAGEAGTVSPGLTVRVQAEAELAALEQIYVQYKGLDGTWRDVVPYKWHTGVGNVTYTDIIAPTFDQTSFGHYRVDTTHVPAGNSSLIRLYVADDLYETLDTSADSDAEGAMSNGTDWQVVSFTMHAANLRPGRPTIGLVGKPPSANANLSDYDGYLVAYWNMDEASGNRADSSGNGHTLVDTNTVTSRAGINGLAAEFTDGNDEKLTIADHADFDITAGFAFSVWVYQDTPAGDDAVFDKGSRYGLYDNGTYTGRVSMGLAQVCSTGVSSEAIWSHLVFIGDSTAGYMYIYMDNVQVGGPTILNTLDQNNDPFVVGNLSTSWWDGAIDELAVWKHIVFADQPARELFVSDLYNSGTGMVWNGSAWVPAVP